MSINILAILVSLAMMLTGAGAAGAPADAARTLRVSDLVLSINDQEIALAPALRVGASTDGESALFDVAVENGDETLFPIQLCADAEKIAVTAAGQAIGVSTETVNALLAQAGDMVASSAQSDEQSQAILAFLKDELLPAYVGLIEAVKDPERQAEIEKKANEVFAQLIDRGEGAEDTVTLGDDEEYAVTRYHYTIEGKQLFELADAVYACDEALQNYYDALIKLYAMMPEESGLNGLTSLSDLAEKMDIDMAMEIDEAISEADGLDMMDAVMTINIPVQQMVEAMDAGDDEDAEAVEPIELPPLVFTITAYQMGENEYSAVNFDYDVDGNGAVLQFEAEKDAEGFSAEINLAVSAADGEGNSVEMGRLTVEAGQAVAEDGAKAFDISYELDVNGQAEIHFSASGEEQTDGTGTGTISLGAVAKGMDIGLSFNVAVTDEAIANAFDSADLTLIEDLSEEGMEALMQDQAFMGKVMQVAGSFMQDAQKLMADEGVQQLLSMFSASVSEVGEAIEDGAAA